MQDKAELRPATGEVWVRSAASGAPKGDAWECEQDPQRSICDGHHDSFHLLNSDISVARRRGRSNPEICAICLPATL